jgi:hypothetical protein
MNPNITPSTRPGTPDGLVANSAENTPLACDLTTIDDEHLPDHAARAAYLFGEGLLERQELPDGFAFRYAAGDYREVADFIENERLCCPFYHFTLEVTPENGPLWLRITGRDGVKEIMQSGLDQLLLEGPGALAETKGA